MTRNPTAIRRGPAVLPTLWGLDPVQLHDRMWAARGVRVVRPGEGTAALPHDAELFLLTDDRTLVLFRLRVLVDRLYWVRPAVLFVRVRGTAHTEDRERVVADERGGFVRLVRDYGGTACRAARVALTRDRRVASLWQAADGGAPNWRAFRRQTRTVRRETQSVHGQCYDRSSDPELARLVDDLIRLWPNPSSTIPGTTQLAPAVWRGSDSSVDKGVRFVGPVWIGAGRRLTGALTVAGPAALWDDPACRPGLSSVPWAEIEPPAAPAAAARPPARSLRRRLSQRGFDVVFACLILLLTLPLYPLIMLAIWLEDGRPFFFAHRRETLGGREFGCLKFRSMRRDADRIKAQIAAKNQSDGPQFFIENDPRTTRVGRWLRKLNLDELPQFLNVLAGDMAVVGPRPSPRAENRCCPAWREARLSVRPGVTGLWQVSRTRQPGLDFQEWIRFDMEYVRRANWWLDLVIIVRTLRVLRGW